MHVSLWKKLLSNSAIGHQIFLFINYDRSYFPVGIYLLKVNNGVFIANFEHISHFVLLFLLLTLNMWLPTVLAWIF